MIKGDQNMKPAKRTQGMNWIAKSSRLAIYLRDGMACCYCGCTLEDGAKLSLDHLKCYSHGGSNDPSNLVTCCSTCNSSRSDRSLREFTDAVAAYRNHGITGDDIRRHINNCRRRALPRAEARKIINRRATWALALEDAAQI
jgi:hypothetical protein